MSTQRKVRRTPAQKQHAKRKAVPGNADWARLYGNAKPQDMRTLPFGIEPERKR